ncbi:curli-like amyloid fiber formation chaperone CsgH [Tranquillimonas alkanivorans]|uniref:CsgH-like domain-containing protein n=1 Tax=Tranquillimonas alkanivorans TaxID=441119 RepID=A0A1I5SYY9_9RHOB|nr:curli-like amyloid fiber formation chaperone CsgH [Tranquillimonas alkanivorans]SFP75989.1 hypothetical protein SAMN04488047_11265 [Tranquillimonas alkanivorans]
MTRRPSNLPARQAALALLLPATLALAGACAVSAASDGTADGPVRCEIAVADTAGGVRLVGIARADRPVSGTFEMQIEKRRGGGSAVIEQSGTFSAAYGTPDTLSLATLGGQAADYDAELTLKWEGKRTVCRLHDAINL